MTNKEAYQLIKSHLDYDKDRSENPEAYVEAIRLAKEVFDKQEPIKPVKEIFGNYDCPVCNAYVEFSGNQSYYKHDYCPNCGQVIDWEEVKE